MKSYFQVYDLENLCLQCDVDMIILLTLVYGNWHELRWLTRAYHCQGIQRLLSQHGEC